MCAKNSFWNLRPPEWLQVTPWCFLRRVAKAMTVFGNSCQKTGEKGRARDSSTIYFDDDKANSSINFSTLCLLRAWIPWELCLAKIRTELHQMKNAESGLFFHRFYGISRRNKPFTVVNSFRNLKLVSKPFKGLDKSLTIIISRNRRKISPCQAHIVHCKTTSKLSDDIKVVQTATSRRMFT